MSQKTKKKNVNFQAKPKQGGFYQQLLAYFETKRLKSLGKIKFQTPHWWQIKNKNEK